MTLTIRDKVEYKPIGKPFKFNVEVLGPIKLPEFNCPFGSRKKCLPKIESISNTGLMLIKFPLGLYLYNQTAYPNITNAISLSLKIIQNSEDLQVSSKASIDSWEVLSVNEFTISL